MEIFNTRMHIKRRSKCNSCKTQTSRVWFKSALRYHVLLQLQFDEGESPFSTQYSMGVSSYAVSKGTVLSVLKVQ